MTKAEGRAFRATMRTFWKASLMHEDRKPSEGEWVWVKLSGWVRKNEWCHKNGKKR